MLYTHVIIKSYAKDHITGGVRISADRLKKQQCAQTKHLLAIAKAQGLLAITGG